MKSFFESAYVLIFFIILMASCQGQEKSKSIDRTTSTACEHVIISDPLIMKAMGRERLIRIHLPKGYFESDKSYPVLYMHDGQNLFDAATSYAGEWEVDESLDKLADEEIEIIVVGIDNGLDKRMNEYNPWNHKRYGIGEGIAYLNFVVYELKPHIDSLYRSKTDKQNTGILGSSMGGIISHFAIMEYASVFGRAGIISPSYWISDQLFQISKTPEQHKIYLSVGSKEGSGMTSRFKKMERHLRANGWNDETLRSRIIENGKHHETAWSSQFIDAVKWLFDPNIE